VRPVFKRSVNQLPHRGLISVDFGGVSGGSKIISSDGFFLSRRASILGKASQPAESLVGGIEEAALAFF
jgi:hypothetical protein